MTDLRNPNIRAKDISKLLSYKYPLIKWDKGIDDNNHWNLASLEDEKHKQKLLAWLKSKNVLPECEALLVNQISGQTKFTCWGNVISEPELYFGEQDFELYDLDLNWALQYKAINIVCFGVFANST
jgi:hypothetical protein